MTEYRPPLHIGVLNVSSFAKDREVAFWVEAVRLQLQVAAQLWSFAAPGMAMYDKASFVPSAEGTNLTVVDNDGDPEAAGYHTPFGGVVDMSDSDSPSRTLSHEALEMLGNMDLSRWERGPDGLLYARELSDAVEHVTYLSEVTLMGISRQVELSDFLLPNWFIADAPPPYNYLNTLSRPFEVGPGGYVVTEDPFAAKRGLRTHPGGAAFSARKLRPSSRTHRLLTG